MYVALALTGPIHHVARRLVVTMKNHSLLSSLSFTKLIGSLELGNVWVLVQLIFGPSWPMNQLNKNPNIDSLETSYQVY